LKVTTCTILHRFAYSANVGMICVQNEKRKNKRKTGQITALKEKFYSDKNTVYLPRHDMNTPSKKPVKSRKIGARTPSSTPFCTPNFLKIPDVTVLF
jgi:hypothetical protein